MIADLKHKFRYGSVIMKLLLVNVGIFVVQELILFIFSMSGTRPVFDHFMEYLYFPADAKLFLTRPWSIFTYQFLHDPSNIFHILFNMLYLYFFGRILLDFLNKKYIVPLYITGGIAGAAGFMLIYTFSPSYDSSNALLFGASASVLALVVAAATLVPDYTVFLILIGPVKLKYIALFAIIVDIVSINAQNNAGGHISHLGGALAGFLFVRSYKRGLHWFDWIFAMGDKLKNTGARKKPKVAYVNPVKTMNKPGTPGMNDDKQKKLDAILDKISKSGYESLSAAEKEFLFTISKDK